MSKSPQFSRQATRPLSQAAYLAFVRKARLSLDAIEIYSDADSPPRKKRLTQAIHSLLYSLRCLRDRHDKLGPQLDEPHRRHREQS